MAAERVGTDAIDAGFVPRLRAEVAFIPVADEGMLYLEEEGLRHRLDRVATAVCRQLDGATSIAAAAATLAATFGEDREVVEADVLGFVQGLGRLGLLEGIAATEPEGHDVG